MCLDLISVFLVPLFHLEKFAQCACDWQPGVCAFPSFVHNSEATVIAGKLEVRHEVLFPKLRCVAIEPGRQPVNTLDIKPSLGGVGVLHNGFCECSANVEGDFFRIFQ